MNVFQIQEQLRTAPDDYLVREMQQPTGMAPQYLVLTELQRRQQLRAGVGAQTPTTTVAQDLSAALGGGNKPEVPNSAATPPPPSMNALQGSATPQQKTSFASGGMVGEKKEGYFDDLNPVFGGVVPWLADKLGGDEWQLGAIGLVNQLFGDKKKEQLLPGQVPANPMQQQQPMQRFAGGGQPQDPQQASMWRNFTGMEIPEWLKRKVQFETEVPAPEKPRPTLSVPDWLHGIDPTYQRIVGPESQGKDVNSIASKGAYIGPGQMNAASYKDALRYAKKRYPDMKFPAWNEAWKKTTPENRPKDYPTMREWAMIGEGYVDFIRDVNKGAGVPTDDAHIYGGWNAGVGNLQKLFNNPDTPIKQLLPWNVIEQNKFDPNAKYRDMIRMWGNRLDRHSGPAAKEVMQTPSKKFFYVPEGEDTSMSENDMIDEMFSADDPDQAILDKIRASAEQAMANKEAAALSGIGKMLEGSPMIPPQVPMPRPKPMAPQRRLAPQDQQTAEDILNDMQWRAARNQRIRKQRLGYAEGGIVGYAEGTGSDVVGKKVVIGGREYRLNKDGIPVDENGVPVMNRYPGMNEWIKSASGADKFFEEMATPQGYSDQWSISDDDSGFQKIGKSLGQLADAPIGLAKMGIGGIGSFLNAVSSGPLLMRRDMANWLQYGRKDLDKIYGLTYGQKKGAPTKAAPAAQPQGSDLSAISKPITDESVYGATQAALDRASSGPVAGGIGNLADYMKQIQGLRGEPKEDPRMEALYATMKRDKELDRWMALADFGGKLAAGSSPYFAQNFGPATSAGIASYKEAEMMARENAMKEANSRLLQRQNDDANYRAEMTAAVDLFQTNQRYKQAIEVAQIAASKRASLAAAQGATPDVQATVFQAEMIDKLVTMGMTEQDARKLVEERMAVAARGSSANNLLKSQKGVGEGNFFDEDIGDSTSGIQ